MNHYQRWRANLFSTRLRFPVVEPRIPPDGPLYKYGQREHIRALVEQGRIRVGTLDAFRKFEDTVRGDRADGTVVFSEGQQGGPQRLHELSPFARRVVGGAFGDAAFDRCYFDSPVAHPNAFAFCVSHELSRSAACKYDGCAEIVDARRFFALLAEHIEAELQAVAQASGYATARVQVTFGRVRYESLQRHGSEFGLINPGFVKDPKFAIECEIRAVWESDMSPRALHLDLVEPRLCEVIRDIEIPDA